MRRLYIVIILLLFFTRPAEASRLWSSGFELNSLAAGVEINNTITNGSIVTSPVNSGTYSWRNNPSGTIVKFTQSFDTSANKTIFLRLYLRIATQPAINSLLLVSADDISINANFRIRFSGSGIRIMDSVNTQQGSDVSLNTGQWYRIEVKCFSNSTTGTLDLLVDGVSMVSTTSNNTGGFSFQQIQFGSGATLTHDYCVDDIAINDANGSFQNSYPGAGNIIHLHPGGVGDSTQWVRGGTDSGANWSQVNEVTPNDATNFVNDVILNESDFYSVVTSGIPAGSTINVVSVGVRFNNDTADVITAFKVQIKKVTGGTISQSPSITPNSTTWKTNAPASPNAYPITLYQDPDSSNWTVGTVNSMQIGQQSSLIGVFKNQVSTIWALVDYIPLASKTKTLATLGVG